MIKLHLFVRAHSHSSRYRKRQRKLRPVRPSRKMELWYKAELLKITRLLSSSARRNLLPAMKRLGPFGGDAALPLSLTRQFETMAREFGGIERTAQRLAELAVRRNLEEVDARLAASIRQSVGVDISSIFTTDGPIRSAMTAATKANVELITSIPQKYLERLRKGVEENFLGGGRHEGLIEQIYPSLRREMGERYNEAPPKYFDDLTPEEVIDRVDEITENRAKLIARDQTSKMNGSFNQARQTSVGIEEYEWQTSGDERVRESHAEKDGKVFSWADPPSDTGHPGEDVQCRCVAIPHIDLDAEEAELEGDED